MKRMLVTFFFLILLLSKANSSSMTFELVGNGGNCAGCEWVKAEGIITKETLASFREFNPASYLVIVLSSQGGELGAGLELGRLFRSAGVATSIGRSERDNFGNFEINDNAECNSACAYAFLGGASRKIDANASLGFHQFYDPAVLNSQLSDSGIVDQEFNNARDQYISGVIVNYLVEMGIDTRLYGLASGVGPLDPIRYLSVEEVVKFKIDNSTDTLEPWLIVPFGEGLLAEALTTTTKRRLRLYCSKDGNHYLTYFIPSENPSAEAKKYIETYAGDRNQVILSADDQSIYTKVILVAPVKDKGEIVIALQLDQTQAQNLARSKSITFNWSEQSNVPRVNLSYYSQTFTIELITGNPKVPLTIFRLCI